MADDPTTSPLSGTVSNAGGAELQRPRETINFLELMEAKRGKRGLRDMFVYQIPFDDIARERDRELEAGSIAPIDRNPILGGASDLLSGLADTLSLAGRHPASRGIIGAPDFDADEAVINFGLDDLTGFRGASDILDDAAHGFPPVQGSGATARLDPRVADIADLTPAGKVATTAAKVAGHIPDFIAAAKKFPAALAMTLFHGSPHKFDRFSLNAIGTGQGAQAQGHGLYFAERRGVAKIYQPRDFEAEEILSEKYTAAVEADDLTAAEVYERAMLHDTADEIEEFFKSPDVAPFHDSGDVDRLVNEIRELERSSAFGHLYEVEIPDEAIGRMLDWDAPLSEQPKHIIEAIRANPAVNQRLGMWVNSFGRDKVKGEEIYEAFAQAPSGGMSRDPEAASKALNEAGIPGIRYLDKGSLASGERTRNIVVFNPDDITSVKRDGDLVWENRLGIKPDEATGLLGRGDNISPPLARPSLSRPGDRVTINGKTFQPQRIDRGDHTLVTIPRDKFISLLDNYGVDTIGPGPEFQGQIGNRIEDFREFLKNNDEGIEVARASFQERQGQQLFQFGDGRHRTRVMLEEGFEEIPIAIEKGHVSDLKKALENLKPEVKIRTDNPGGDWLKSQRKRAAETGYLGDVTAYLEDHKPVMVNPRFLEDIPGAMDEHLKGRGLGYKAEAIRESLRSGEAIRSPIFITVDYNGKPLINEGNNRLAVAIQEGLTEVPVEIRWFAGGEEVPGPLSPDNLQKMVTETSGLR